MPHRTIREPSFSDHDIVNEPCGAELGGSEQA